MTNVTQTVRGCKPWPMKHKYYVGVSRDQWNTSIACRSRGRYKIKKVGWSQLPQAVPTPVCSSVCVNSISSSPPSLSPPLSPSLSLSDWSPISQKRHRRQIIVSDYIFVYTDSLLLDKTQRYNTTHVNFFFWE